MESKKLRWYSGRRAKVAISLGAVSLVVGTLLYYEQVAVIYVLSSIALIALLLAVALSNLETVSARAQQEAMVVPTLPPNTPIAPALGKRDSVRIRSDRLKQKTQSL